MVLIRIWAPRQPPPRARPAAIAGLCSKYNNKSLPPCAARVFTNTAAQLLLQLHSSAAAGGRWLHIISYSVIAQCVGGACDDLELVWCNAGMVIGR